MEVDISAAVDSGAGRRVHSSGLVCVLTGSDVDRLAAVGSSAEPHSQITAVAEKIENAKLFLCIASLYLHADLKCSIIAHACIYNWFVVLGSGFPVCHHFSAIVGQMKYRALNFRSIFV